MMKTILMIVVMAALAGCIPQSAVQPSRTGAVLIESSTLTKQVNTLADRHDQEMARQKAVREGQINDGPPFLADDQYQKCKAAAMRAQGYVAKASTAASKHEDQVADHYIYLSQTERVVIGTCTK